jgi:hypothetical protein
MTNIHLGVFFAQQKAHEDEVAARQKHLDEAVASLNAFNGEKKEEIRAALEAGATTGDPLQDEIVRSFGLWEQTLAKLTEFSRQLVAHKGKEFAIVCDYQRRIRFTMLPSDSGESDFFGTRSVIFGVLSGDRLRLTDSDISAGFVFPFSRYAEWDGGDPVAYFSEPKTVISLGAHLNGANLFDAIMGRQMMPRGSDSSVSILFDADRIESLLGGSDRVKTVREFFSQEIQTEMPISAA